MPSQEEEEDKEEEEKEEEEEEEKKKKSDVWADMSTYFLDIEKTGFKTEDGCLNSAS